MHIRGNGNFAIDSQSAPGTTSVIAGGLQLAPSKTLQAVGSGTSVQFVGGSNIDGGNLYARAGASLQLPALTSYTNSVEESTMAVLQATGAGSVLDLRNVTSIVGATNQFTQLRIEARDGGKVDLRSVASVTDPAQGNTNGSGFNRRAARVSADGTNSQIDLSLLTTIVDRSNGGDGGFWFGPSLLSATNNGTVLVPLLASVSNTDINVDATGSLALPALSSVLSSTIEVNGGTFSTPQLSNIDGVSIYVRGGANFALPTVTSYTNSVLEGHVNVLQATGAGSVLDLRNVTSIVGATNQFTKLRVEAHDGGKVDLRRVATVTDPADSNPDGSGFEKRSTRISADGVNSQIDLSLLTTIVDRSNGGDGGFWFGPSLLSATNNGTVLVPLLASVSNTDINVDATGSLALPALSSVLSSTIEVNGGTFSTPQLSNIDGVSIYVRGGANFALPTVTSYTNSVLEGHVNVLQATGAGSVLDLRNVTSIVGATNQFTKLRVEAHDGGKVDLRRVATVTDPADSNPDGSGFEKRSTRISADGVNSQIDLSLLTTIVDRSNGGDGGFWFGPSRLSATNNGTVLVPLLASVSNTDINVDATGSLALPALSSVLSSTIEVNGGTFSTPQLSNIDGVSIYVRGGATFALPTVTSYTNSVLEGRETVLQATGAGSVLDLRNVTSIVGATNQFTKLRVEAHDGGKVDLRRVATVTDPADSNPDGSGFEKRSTRISADGVNSQIDLSLLTTIVDRSNGGDGGFWFGPSRLSATNNGTVLVPLLASISKTDININATGNLNITSLQSIVNGAINVTGKTSVFPNVVDVRGSSIETFDNARLTFPLVREFDVSGQTIRGQIDVPILNNITMTSGTVNIVLPSALDNVAVDGGEWVVSGPVLVQQAFHWNGGSLRGAGSLVLGTDVAGVVDGSTPKSLGLTIENSGRLVLKGANIQFGPNGDAGILKNLSGKTLSISGDIDLVIQSANAAHSVINEGNLSRFGTGETRIDVPVTNSGNINVQQGILNLNGNTSLNLNGSSFVGNLPGTTLRVAGSFTGNTTNSDSNSLVGGLTFAGGTLADPLQFEVMGADFGGDSKGFQKNFSVSQIRLDNAYVKLRDSFNNQIGSGSEAVYVDTLVVPTGSTLDLNNLKVYSRSSLISGTVIGGDIQSIPDGGSLQLNAPSFGSITSQGQVDEWSFFGRTGQKISLTINPGSLVEPSPVSPVIGFATVELVTPNGDVIASASNTVEGQLINLVFESLPSAGTYKIRVKAPLSNPTLTGNYLLTGLDATIDIYPLIVNQQVNGIIENGRSVDRWTFGGLANQQVALRVANASFNGAQFKLTGPSGFVGFTNLLGDSELITLPSNGVYQIEVDSAFGSSGNYAFTLEQTGQSILELNVPYTGTMTGSSFTQLFSFDVNLGTPLSLLFQSAAAEGVEVYLRRGSPPTRQKFDYQSGSFADTQSILVSLAAPGTFYVLVYARGLIADADFSLKAETTALLLTNLSPAFAVRNSVTTISVSGLGFLPGTTVQLISSSNVATPASAISLDSTTQVSATFDLNNLAIGTYDIKVSLADGTTKTRAMAFEVLPPGQPKLETRLIMPPALGRNATATIYVEYANTGTASMAAPQLTLRSSDPDDSDKPFLTLDASKLVAGFWTSAVPDGFSSSVQFTGNGAVPGLLAPGERVRMPVYYAGLLAPWDFADTQVELQIFVSDETDTSPIDWPSLSDKLKPSWISVEAWPAVFSNLQAQIGTTWGDYYRAMNDNSSFLYRMGQVVTDQSELWSFELQQALGYSPVDTLASTTDATVTTPGLSLSFGRNFATTLPQRYDVGVFGRGWIAPWQTKVIEESDGTVIISDAAGSQRRFQPDRRISNVGGGGATRYFGSQGETGTLIKASGYKLSESNGRITWFRPDGTLEYTEDPNGNRISTTIAAGQLTKLTHSNGASLTMTYNSASRIASIADSVGRTTTYGYDATNNYLLSVTTVSGTVAYTYNTTGTVTQLHTLKSITDATGITQTFEYDSQGRLSAIYMGSNINRYEYGYDATGTISTTDSAGSTSRVFVDHRGLIVKHSSGNGYYVNYTFDENRQLKKTTDALGRTQSFTQTKGGTLISTTNAMGNTSTFLPGGPHDQPSTFIDSKGNQTRYSYDSAGNLSRTNYADGSIEQISHDANGNAIQFINRRGQVINMTRNAAGQLTSESFPDGTSNYYSYDSRNRLTTVVEPQGTTIFTYDASDQMTHVSYPKGRWLSFEYDSAGRRTKMQDNDGDTTQYIYDLIGRLSELRDAASALVVKYTYDSFGRLAREDKGNGTYTINTYDLSSRLIAIFNYAPNGFVNSKFIYQYDLLNRRTGMTTIDGEWHYEYDLLSQLTKAVFVSVNPLIPNQDLKYSYDSMGNRTQAVINGVVTNYATNNMNQYVTAGTTSFEYDRDGNLVSENGPSGTKRFSYDHYNRLTSFTTSQITATYEYDTFSNRTAESVNGLRKEYVWDPAGIGSLATEYDMSNNSRKDYTHGFGLISVTSSLAPSLKAFYDFDAIGSTVGISRMGGAYSNQYGYEPFGATILIKEDFGNSHRFVGKYGVTENTSGLFLMRARHYDSNMGRFLSQDPIKLSGGDANTYRYTQNLPLSFIDPSGLFSYGDACKESYKFSFGGLGGILGGLATGGNPFVIFLGGGAGALGGGIAGDLICGSTGNFSWPALPAPPINYYDPGGGPERNGSKGPAQPRDFYDYKYGYDDWRRSFPSNCGAGGEGESIERERGEGECGSGGGFGPSGGGDNPPPPGPSGPGSGPGGTGDGGGSGTAESVDPNEKFGATGYGTQAFIAANIAIPYRINFENLGAGSVPTPTRPATAPAQRVEVTDQLSNLLDWNTFEFTEFGFGDTVVSLTGKPKFAFQSVSMNYNNQTFNVDVGLDFDPANGFVRVVFQSVDPRTELPPDVLTGFLPPEDGTGRGMGHFAYSVQPKSNLITGTQIRNIATIVFDGQTAIDTNQIDPQNPAAGTDPNREALNTIDADVPTSSVAALSEISPPSFTVAWAGSDGSGSGVVSYDVYVSDNGGVPTLWKQNFTLTQAEFVGQGGHTYRFYSIAKDGVGFVELPPANADAITTVVSPPLSVANFTQSPSGVSVRFNAPVELSVLNLYQGVNAALGSADVSLVGAATGTVSGSLLWDSTTNTATFIKTGGVLLPDTYTLTLFTRADGIRQPGGELLDGNGDGVVGDNYVNAFTVQSNTSQIVSIPDFARGATSTAGQNVNLSFDNGNPGVPVTLSDGAGVLAVDFDIVYNPNLIQFSSAFFGVLPSGWNTTVNAISSSRMRVLLAGTTPLAAGPQTITRLLASIPANAPYGSSDLVRIENLAVFTQAGGSTPVPSIGDAGLHKAVFVGDTNADGQYTAQDAGWNAGVAGAIYSGFDAYSWTDPVIVADVNQNSLLDGFDSSWIARKGLSSSLQPEIPNLPSGSIAVQSGVDPTIAADALIPTRRGATVNVPIRITDSAAGLWGVDVFLDFNTNLLDLSNGLNAGGVALAGMFAAEAGWSIDSFADDATGKLRLAIYRATPSATTAGVIANVALQVKPNAAFGVTPIVVDGYANVPPFSFTFVSGSVNVINSPPTDINLNQNTVLENTSTIAADLLFGQLATVDLDPVDSYAYDLVAGTGDTDNARFRMVDDKIFIRQGETLDFENKPSYSVRVRSTDSGGLTFVKQLTLNVTDVNEPVVLTRTIANVTGDVLTQLTNTGTWSDPESGAVTLSASLGTVTKNADGTWNWTYQSSVALSAQSVTISASDGVNVSTTTFSVTAYTTIATRGLVYVGATGASASTSLASDKSALLPGQSSTFANYTNYSRGLNGLVIDVVGLPSTVTNAQLAASLLFANWNGIAAEGFVALSGAAVPTVAIIAGGIAGSSRVSVIFPDNTVQNTWLRVTVVANANTGLAANDVFYFGNVIGELDFGNTETRLRVNGQDAALILANQSPGANSAGVTNKFDLDRNGRVNGQDYAILLANQEAAGIVAPITVPSSRQALAKGKTNSSGGSSTAAPMPIPMNTNLTRHERIDQTHGHQLVAPALKTAKLDDTFRIQSIATTDFAVVEWNAKPTKMISQTEEEEESLKSLDSIFASMWH